MNGLLTDIIQSLDKEEIRNFKLYSTRIQTQQEKKLLYLFDRIKKDNFDEYADELVTELFPNSGKNPYYRLKNRLIEDLEQSLLMLHRTRHEEFQLHNLLLLARIFIYKSNFKTGFHYLKKAEGLAKKREYFHLLQIIYDEIILLAGSYKKIDPEDYIARRTAVLQEYIANRQIDDLIAVIQYRLGRRNFVGKNKEVTDALEQAMKNLDVASDVLRSPTTEFRVYKCVRNLLLQKKDFKSLQDYLLETLDRFERGGMFDKANHESKVVMLSWIINTLTKNRFYRKSLEYTEHLRKALLEFDKLMYPKYIWLYYQSQIINFSYLGSNDQVIRLLEDLQKQKQGELNHYQRFYIPLNLCSAYYSGGDLDKSLKSLSMLLTKEVYGNLDPNWKLRISILEIMLHYECNDLNYAEGRLQEVKRIFRTTLRREGYERDKAFLQILASLLKYPDALSRKREKEKVAGFIAGSPSFEVGSNEVVDYAIWLQALSDKRSYYDLLLDSSAMGTK